MRQVFTILVSLLFVSAVVSAQHDAHEHPQSAEAPHSEATHHEGGVHYETVGECQIPHEDPTVFNPGKVAFHHISDQNVYSIGPFQLPLPCILYSEDGGLDVFLSSKFKPDAHGIGEAAYNRYVLYDGAVRRVKDPAFPMGLVELGHHRVYGKDVPGENGKDKHVVFVCYDGKEWACDNKSTLDGGLLGGGKTSFTDFSLTKNVVSMFIIFFLMTWLFLKVARMYKERDGQAPTGIQSFMETIFVFIQDEVAKPFLGPRWEQFLPFLMSLFFFILGLNLFGQIPFFGGSNVTGNLSVTFALAVFAFVVTNINGNAHYWKHIFNMPGIPGWVKIVVTPVEFMGLFIKPITLTLRLFGNILAGHMVIVIFVGLIFIFGKNGTEPATALGTSIGSILLTLFMMSIELLVAFIQAFVFTILTASYIGAATEEAHDH
ncbi:MAG: ATP synthase F0 subunit A [Bacteroidetes bacterium]|nr:MAG: ATP synthase F0 subunit A [Bacteroidota bacterium]